MKTYIVTCEYLGEDTITRVITGYQAALKIAKALRPLGFVLLRDNSTNRARSIM